MGTAFIVRRARRKKSLVLLENGVLNPLLGELKIIYRPEYPAQSSYRMDNDTLYARQAATNESSRTGYFGFDNAVSTKGYKYLHFEGECSSNYPAYQYLGINSDNGSDFTAYGWFTSQQTQVVTVPIAEYQGEYYVLLGVYAYTGQASAVRISRIWLDNSAEG